MHTDFYCAAMDPIEEVVHTINVTQLSALAIYVESSLKTEMERADALFPFVVRDFVMNVGKQFDTMMPHLISLCSVSDSVVSMLASDLGMLNLHRDVRFEWPCISDDIKDIHICQINAVFRNCIDMLNALGSGVPVAVPSELPPTAKRKAEFEPNDGERESCPALDELSLKNIMKQPKLKNAAAALVNGTPEADPDVPVSNGNIPTPYIKQTCNMYTQTCGSEKLDPIKHRYDAIFGTAAECAFMWDYIMS